MITRNRFLLRFILLITIFITFPFPLDSIPFLGFIGESWEELKHLFIPWIAKHILGLEKEITVFTNGSGDTTYDYVQLLFHVVISLIGAGIWSVIDRKERSLRSMNYWLLVLLRYYLGYVMLSYGMVKVIQLQFPQPSFMRLLQPFGDASPMGLAWTFMGFSQGYNLFVGLGEVIGGILLFHRRTSILGAIILVAVISNIVAINFFFDVPVKIYSSTLLLMDFVILMPHINNLLRVILFNQPTESIEYMEPFSHPSWKLGKNIMKWITVVWLVGSNIYGALESDKEYGKAAPKPKLYGLHETEVFIHNGDTLKRSLEPSLRWRYLIFERSEFALSLDEEKKRTWYKVEMDSLRDRVYLTNFRDTTSSMSLNFVMTDSSLILDGFKDGDTLHIEAITHKKEDFLLMNRGFNWINEYPFNR